MTDIQYEGDNIATSSPSILYSRFEPSSGVPWLIRVLLQTHLAKTQGQAIYTLFAITGLFVLLTITIFGYSFGWFSRAPTTYREDIPEHIRQTLPQEILSIFPSRNDR